MTYEELIEEIERIIPNANFERDNHGQIVIYTGLTEKNGSDELVAFDPDDVDD